MQMTVPALYGEIKKLAGCDVADSRGALKFFMGHTHCNVPHPHGHNSTGFMVAGMGMEGCGNYGIPILDTREERVRVWHFEVESPGKTSRYDSVIKCIQAAGDWKPCTYLADKWLDEPLPPKL